MFVGIRVNVQIKELINHKINKICSYRCQWEAIDNKQIPIDFLCNHVNPVEGLLRRLNINLELVAM